MGGIGFSTAGVTDSCKSLSGSREPNWGPLEEQGVLLTAEPSSLQPHILCNAFSFLVRKTLVCMKKYGEKVLGKEDGLIDGIVDGGNREAFSKWLNAFH